MATYFKQGRACRFQAFTRLSIQGSIVKPITSWPYAERLFLDVCDAPIRSSSSWLFRRFMW
jgi:hypothetical protein